MLVVSNADGSQRQVFHDGSMGGVAGLAGATDVVVSPDGNFVYVASSTSDSIAIFARSATGDLSFVQKVNGTADTFATLTFSADGTHLYAGGAAGLTVYSVNATTGALSGAASVAGLAAAGVNEVVESADGAHLFVVTASDSLAVVDSQTLAVTQTLSGSGLAGASDIVLSGSNLYVTSASGDTLAVFAVSGATVSHLQTLRNGADGVRGVSGPTDVAVTPDGKFILVSGQDSNSVSVFQRADDGKLTFVQIVSNNVGGVSGIDAPAELIVSGSSLLVASGAGMIGTLSMDLTQAQPDVLVIDFAAIETVSVVTGAGADTITVTAAPSAEVATLEIATGEGADHVWISAAAQATIVRLGDGDDPGGHLLCHGGRGGHGRGRRGRRQAERGPGRRGFRDHRVGRCRRRHCRGAGRQPAVDGHRHRPWRPRYGPSAVRPAGIPRPARPTTRRPCRTPTPAP